MFAKDGHFSETQLFARLEHGTLNAQLVTHFSGEKKADINVYRNTWSGAVNGEQRQSPHDVDQGAGSATVKGFKRISSPLLHLKRSFCATVAYLIDVETLEHSVESVGRVEWPDQCVHSLVSCNLDE